MKRLLSFVGVTALIALGVGLGVAYMLLNPEPLVLGQDAHVSAQANGAASSTLRNEAGGYIDVRPEGEVRSLFIFYPGGLVRPQAYEWLGFALAPVGVRTVIPVMPLDLAVIATNRASDLLEALAPLPESVVIGGHSLGGAMAARYALNHPDQFDGLVLMGAFSADGDDLSGLSLEALVLAAENDGLASLTEVRQGVVRLPDTELTVIEGAVHSFFGRYGPQRGDGLPSVTRAAAEAQISAALERYFLALAP